MIKSLATALVYFVLFFSAHGSDYCELRAGLSNSRFTFEQTRKGRVVFLGGSITHMHGWKELVAENLQKRFPETQFDFIHAGIPSTGSTPGAFRLERDVFKKGRVDLLFEEAAVNMIEFKVDDGDWSKRDLYTKWSGGLHIPWLHVLAAELQPKQAHRLTVRISDDKNSKSQGHACRVVHLAVNGKDNE